MKRQKISQDKLLEILVAEVALHISDSNLLWPQIKIRPSSGEPNWEASLGHASGWMVDAFLKARKTIHALYDVDWP